MDLNNLTIENAIIESLNICSEVKDHIGPINYADPDKVLLLGSNGLIGRKFLHTLLKNNNISTVYIILRNVNSYYSLISNTKFTNHEHSKLSVLFGDVSKPNFSLCKKDYDKILQAHSIYNFAGSVSSKNLSTIYTNNTNIFKQTLLFSQGVRKIYHASSLSVFVSTYTKWTNRYTEDPLNKLPIIHNSKFKNVYSYSKFIQDYALSCFTDNYSLSRFGLVIDQQSPLFYHLLTDFLKHTQTLPNNYTSLEFDFTPLKYSVQKCFKKSIDNISFSRSNIKSTIDKPYLEVCPYTWFKERNIRPIIKKLFSRLNPYSDNLQFDLFEMTNQPEFEHKTI